MALTTLDPKTALIVIDLQKGIANGNFIRPIGKVIDRTRALINVFRAKNLRLVSIFSAQNRRLRALLSDTVAVGAGLAVNVGGSLLLPRKSGRNSLRVTVTPSVSQLPGGSSQLAALVFVSDPEGSPIARSEKRRALYALTPLETRVADFLLQGLETREVAHELGLTLETACFHLKRVLSKTGTRRQTELMRLMLFLPQV